MATHDYVIDNQSAPAFRSDLNNALLAIVSQNSASTAPTTTYANMFWYDTATNILKKRNEANSAWINLGTVDEGTGTFTPTGERALASQAQAEAGTDNATVITPLRSAQAISAQIGSATAGLAWGAVGTYALVTTNADITAQTWRNPGDTISGSLIGAAQAYGKTSPAWNTIGTSLSGTWRAMALFATPNTNRIHGLALRIS